MGFYGRSSRLLVEQELKTGVLKDSQIVGCDLHNLKIANAVWDHTDISDLHADDIGFENADVTNSSFTRSGFLRARFLSSAFDNMTLNGLTLIKSQWINCTITNSTIQNNCLQRTCVHKSRITSSSLIDFEALNATMDSCIIAHSLFSINYGSGMNGFSDAVISRCIFYNCRFEGYPFRGASMNGNVFLYCSGALGDEIECINVAGIGLRGRPRSMPVQSRAAALRNLARFNRV